MKAAIGLYIRLKHLKSALHIVPIFFQPLLSPHHYNITGGEGEVLFQIKMRTLNSCTLLLSCAILLAISLPLVSCDLIADTCNETPYHRLCVATLRRDNRSRDADTAELALIIVDAVKEKANSTLKCIKEIQKTQLKLANVLMVCNENYNVILRIDIPKAVGSLRQNPRFAEHGMAAAGIEAEGCESSFEKPFESPLTDMNSAVYELSAVALSIIRILLHKL